MLIKKLNGFVEKPKKVSEMICLVKSNDRSENSVNDNYTLA